MLNPSITAIIPTLSNTVGLLSLLPVFQQNQIPLVVVDNAPTREKENAVKAYGGKYLPQRTNRGFAAAINKGVQEVASDWILVLNDDIAGINGKIIGHLLQEAIMNDWVAITPRLVDRQGHTENLGYTVMPIGKVRLNFDKTRTSDTTLDGITAAALLIRTDVFKTIGGFDEKFFAYLEDVDLCLRLKEKGYHFGVLYEVTVTHAHQMTTSKLGKDFKARLDMINWWRLVFKHRRFWQLTTIPGMLVERGRNLSGYLKSIV